MVNQKAAMCKPQTKSMERTAGTGVGEVALADKLGRSSGVDRGIRNWAWSARNAPLQGRKQEGGGGQGGLQRLKTLTWRQDEDGLRNLLRAASSHFLTMNA